MLTGLVVNYSTPQDLLRLIASAHLWEPNMTWVIRQNGEVDTETQEALDKIEALVPDVVFSLGDNVGHGAGINIAASLADVAFDPEHLFILNPDCRFTGHVTEKLITFLQEDPLRGMVGPKQMDSNSRVTAGGIVGTNEAPQHRGFRVPDPGNELFRDSVESVVVAGSAILMRPKEFFRHKGMLEAVHYYSETWLCYHMRAHGWRLWYHGDAVMVHEWHRSSKRGGRVDQAMPEDRKLFRRMCDEHQPPIVHN